MQVIFVENENPSRNSSGGIMTYVLNLSDFFRKKGIETVLFGIGEANKNNHKFSSFVSICKKNDASNPKYLFHLMRKLPTLQFKKTAIIHFNPVFASETKGVRNLFASKTGLDAVGIRDEKGFSSALFLAVCKTDKLKALTIYLKELLQLQNNETKVLQPKEEYLSLDFLKK